MAVCISIIEVPVMDYWKKMWKYYFVLFLIVIMLGFSIAWIYKLVQSYHGRGPALLVLTITVMVVLLIAIAGAVHTHGICCEVRKQVETLEIPTDQPEGKKPMVLRILDLDIPPPHAACPTKVVEVKEADIQYEQLLCHPKKRRGKQSRYPKDQIRKTVLKWENKNSFIDTRNLEQFLADEFGYDGGVLQVATSTFYDWRRDVLKEIQEQQGHPPNPQAPPPSNTVPSVPNSPKKFS